MGSITSANGIFMLGVTSVWPTPQQLQGWTVDDMFTVQTVDASEIKMGVDGKMSAGFVFVPYKVGITLQADSASALIFDSWYAAQRAQVDVYFANGLIRLPSVARSYVMTNGILSSYTVFPDAKKTLDPFKYEVTFESIVGAPF